MRFHLIRRTYCKLGVVALSGCLLLAGGGCPVDTDSVLTATVEAALTAMVSSFVDTLGTYLAGN